MKTISPILFLLCTLSIFGQGHCFEDCKTNFAKQEDSILAAYKDTAFALKVIERTANDRITKLINGLQGCKVPDFSVKTIDGKSYSLKNLKGKIIVLNFWFTSCKSCIEELSALNKLVDDFADKGVVFIALSTDNTGTIEEFLLNKEFRYNIVSSEYNINDAYCINGFPTNIVIDKLGIVKQIFRGGKIDESAKTEAYDKIKPVLEKCLIEN